jgi:hypothetical protein
VLRFDCTLDRVGEGVKEGKGRERKGKEGKGRVRTETAENH